MFFLLVRFLHVGDDSSSFGFDKYMGDVTNHVHCILSEKIGKLILPVPHIIQVLKFISSF